jgi:hypothetical protein
LLVSLLLLGAGVGWLIFTLNRPPIVINSGTPGISPASTTLQAQPTTAQSTQAPGQTVAPGSQTPLTANAAPSGTTAVVSKAQGYGVVISRTLNMRGAPNTEAAVIKTLKSGDIIEIASRSGGWYQTTEGLWVSGSYLEVRQTRLEAESYARELATA